MSTIDYSVRIHHSSLCTCKRILNDNKNIVPTEEQILLVIERIFSHKKNLIYILGEKDNESDTESSIIKSLDNNSSLNAAFKNMEESRKKISEYFRKSIFSDKTNFDIRREIKFMKTICFCNNIITCDESTANAGIIILGSKFQMQKISSYFNKNITPNEFSELEMFEVSKIPAIKYENLSFSIQLFIKDKNFEHFNGSKLWTITGIETNSGKKAFSFGKREWFAKQSETPFECAKRELYEEFNIYISDLVYNRSKENKKIQQIYIPGSKLFLVYLSNRTNISFRANSDTILIDEKYRPKNNSYRTTVQ